MPMSVDLIGVRVPLLALLALAASGLAQDPASSPAPSAANAPTLSVTPPLAASPTPAASPSPTAIPSPTATPSAIATPTPSLLKKTGVKIQFIPPPMDGTISLGIYDDSGKLVRTLHRAATGDEFVAALEGYITHWDGMDDAGNPLPAGHYDARGYMVGAVTVKAIDPASLLTSGSNATPAASPAPSAPQQTTAANPNFTFPNGKPFVPQTKIRARLVGNPLNRDRAGSAELAVASTRDGTWLELTDGLPLKQISATPTVATVLFGRSAPGEPLTVILSQNGAAPEAYSITKVSDMMAFDCGGFDFAGAGK